MTPMIKQYFALKKQCGDAVLFFRMGDFYEVFGDDALTVAPVLNIVLTNRHREEKLPFCGVPHHSYKPYCRKLIDRGFKVAVAEQIGNEMESGKGIIKREIVKIMTPGLRDDLDSIAEDKPNYLASLFEDPNSRSWSLILSDISTGELRLGEFPHCDAVLDFVRKSAPTEILVRVFQHETLKEKLATSEIVFSPLPEAVVSDTELREQLLQKCFPALISAKLEKNTTARTNLAALAAYLQQNYFTFENFLTLKPLIAKKEMDLPPNVIRDLEIFATIQSRSAKGSLYNVINNTLTPMGARSLRYTLAHPLNDQGKIETRLKEVSRFVASGYTKVTELRTVLKGFPDLERLSNQVLTGKASPEQIIAIVQALAKIRDLTVYRQELSTYKRLLAEMQELIHTALQERPGRIGAGVEVFRPEYDQKLGRFIELAVSGEQKIAAYEQQLRQKTAIANLKVKKHKSLGLLIEVTKANLSRIPDYFIRRQTMLNCERFITEELVELDSLLANALTEAIARESELYQLFLRSLQKYHLTLIQVSAEVATLDLHQSHAFTALKENYCRPVLHANMVSLRGCRHPVIEKLLGAQRFVPNDIELDDEQKMMLITGPNMAGKSTVMRQVAICAILHQTGAYVPAVSAALPLFDNIFTRIGASDNITAGQSTFMVEMIETATILRESSPHSLVIVDEIGRGTSTSDGLALAQAILENLVRLRCFCLFSTHFHELVPAARKLPGIRAMQTEVREDSHFTHKLIPGSCRRSFGIEVARMAGVPSAVLKKATTLLQESQNSLLPADSACIPSAVHKDNELLQKIARRFDKLNVYRTTPLQALDFINDIKKMLTRTSQPPLM